MRLNTILNSLRTRFARWILILAVATSQAPALYAGTGTEAAIQEAVSELAPENFSEYVWTFIRRGETAKIKGKGPGKITALYDFDEIEGGIPVLTIVTFENRALDGSILQRRYSADGTYEENFVGPDGSKFTEICDASGKCRTVSVNAGQAGKPASANAAGKSSNAGGKGKAKGKNK